MSEHYCLHAWELSYFSAKLRAYLRYKGLPYKERRVDAWTLLRRIPRRTGASVMPVLVTPAGEWLQDTTDIIQQLEGRHPQHPVIPAGPRQRIFAMLVEAWADEFWIPPAMHYRWSYPENYSLFEREAGAALLPLAPAALRRALARRVAGQLRGYLPGVGVLAEQLALIERWTRIQLDALNTHLAQYPYLLGDAPCLADFALIGPLHAHLGRDPWPRRELIAPRLHLSDWIRRVHEGQGADGAWLADDEVPQSLQALLESVVREFLPQMEATATLVAQTDPGRHRLPRALGRVSCPLADGQFSRLAMPYSLWMLQRAQRAFLELPEPSRQAVSDMLGRAGRREALHADLGPPLERAGLSARWASATQPARCGMATPG